MNERDIFIAALQITDPAARDVFLTAACAEPGQKERLKALLEAEQGLGSFLEVPAAAADLRPVEEPGRADPDRPRQDAPDVRARNDALLPIRHKSGEPLKHADPTPSATWDSPDPLEAAGTTIGPYKLLQQIGEGGMGTVYMAEQTEPVRRRVALKIIKPGMDSRQVIARFEAERQALAMMDHQNIARVLDAGTTGAKDEGGRKKDEQETTNRPNSSFILHPSSFSGRPYFVMELVHGVPITRYCDDNKLTPRERLALFVPVCQAIQHAHQKGIIHRDVKPSNVLVTMYDDKPVPKVIDFGVAKAAGQQLTDKTLVTGFGAIVGTLEYMSPEQAQVNQLDIDTRSDIYSLGVLLYELLAGSPPFSRKELEKAGMLEMLRVIREQEPSKPSTKLSTAEGLPTLAANRGTEPAKLTKLVRGELDWIVMKALEKDRNRRYETANGFAMDVQRYLADEPVLAGPPTLRYRLRKFVARNKRSVAAGSIILLCLLGGIIGTSLGLVWAMRERDEKAKALAAEIEAKTAAIQAGQAKDHALAAETKARAAEQQARDKAMAALRSMTDEAIENQMARGTTLTDENKTFLRKIITQYEGFAAITADDADSLSIRAEGYFRVGRMRYRLGELKEAEAAYMDALAIRKRLAADFPSRPEFRQDLASSHNNLGILLKATGRPKEAETAYTDAVALQKQLAADFPTRPEFRQDLASSHNSLGILLKATGRPTEAETAYKGALAIQKQLAADFPTRPDLRRDLAECQVNLGILLDDTGRPDEAETAYADSLAIQKQLAADFPTRPDLRLELARSQLNLGNMLQERYRFKEAVTAYTESREILKQLAADFPSRPEFRWVLAMSHDNLGAVLHITGRRKEAEKAFTVALAIFKQLAADFPTRREFRQDLALCHNNLGNVLSETGRLKEGETSLSDALAIYTQLVADFPNQPELRISLARSCGNLARRCNNRRDFKAAKAYLEEGMPHNKAALQANSRNLMYREHFRTDTQVLVAANAGLQDQAAALQAALKLRDLGWDPPKDAYYAAHALALCIPIVEKDPQLDAAKRQAAVQFYGDETMKMLQVAVGKGFTYAGHGATDPALHPLRDRGDFKKLIQELEKNSTTEPDTR
jgi:eukaryotic-like serine/threonine-protein kinase